MTSTAAVPHTVGTGQYWNAPSSLSRFRTAALTVFSSIVVIVVTEKIRLIAIWPFDILFGSAKFVARTALALTAQGTELKKDGILRVLFQPYSRDISAAIVWVIKLIFNGQIKLQVPSHP